MISDEAQRPHATEGTTCREWCTVVWAKIRRTSTRSHGDRDKGCVLGAIVQGQEYIRHGHYRDTPEIAFELPRSETFGIPVFQDTD